MQRLRIRLLQFGLGAENVIEGAVDDGVEPVVQSLQLGRVGHPEVHRYPSLLRVLPGAFNGGG
jgi:hypothetical protein